MSRPRAATSVRDEHLGPSGAEALDRGRAIFLRAIGVNRGRAQARRDELPREPIGADLRVDEHDRRIVRAAQVLRQEGDLLTMRQDPRFVRDGLRRTSPRADLDEHGVGRQRVREPHHFLGHRRREEHRLTDRGRRHRFRDLSHVRPEAHVHHAVGFVEDEDLELREVADVAPHVIEQSSRGRDDDVDAGFERALLRAPSARRRRRRRSQPARDTRSPGSRRRSASPARAWARGSARASHRATLADPLRDLRESGATAREGRRRRSCRSRFRRSR